MNHSRLGPRAAMTALVLLLVISTAPGAAARDLDTTDVTNETTSKVWLAPSWKEHGVGVSRFADYRTSATGRFSYYAGFGELWEIANRCVLSRNRKVLVDGPCNEVDGTFELGGSGKYLLTVSGRRMASWKFTRPTDIPHPLTPATCVLESVTPGKVTSRGPTFILRTNDQCTDGYWYYQVDDPQGRMGTYARFDLPANGRVLAMGLNGSTDACTVSFVFLPEGDVVSSSLSLATTGGPNLTWQSVPSVAGY